MATKAEMISDVAEAAGVSKSDAESVLGAFFDHVTATAMAGGDVSWPGFGKFSTTQRSARTGRNPQTGAPVAHPGIDGDEVQRQLGAQGDAERALT